MRGSSCGNTSVDLHTQAGCGAFGRNVASNNRGFFLTVFFVVFPEGTIRSTMGRDMCRLASAQALGSVAWWLSGPLQTAWTIESAGWWGDRPQVRQRVVGVGAILLCDPSVAGDRRGRGETEGVWHRREAACGRMPLQGIAGSLRARAGRIRYYPRTGEIGSVSAYASVCVMAGRCCVEIKSS